MRALLKSRSLRIAACVLAAVALYAAGGFLLAPKLLRAAIVDRTRSALGLRASVGDIRINPFLLQLDVRNFAIADPAGNKLVGFGRLYVDFEISSLWRGAFVFKDIELASPRVHAVVDAGGALNLLRLAPEAAAPAASPKRLPRVQIALLHVSDGGATFEDHSRASYFATQLAPIDFAVRDFTTGAAGGEFVFSGKSKLDERIDWHGHLSVQPIESDGEIRIANLRATTLWSYLRDRLRIREGFALRSGDVGLDAHYRVNLQHAPNLRVDMSQAKITDLGIAPQGGDNNWITLPSLEVTGASLDLADRKVHVQGVALRGLQVAAWLAPDESLNLMSLAGTAGIAGNAGNAGPTAAAAKAPAAPTAAASAAPAAPPPWQVDLDKFTIEDARLSAEDRGTKPAVRLLLAPLSIEVDALSSDLERPVQVKLDTGVDGAGRFAASGDITPAPFAAKLALQAKNIDLRTLQPYIAKYTSLTLQRGRLGAALEISYRRGKPAMMLDGDLRVDDLRTIDNALRRDFVNWRRLDVHGLKYQLHPDRLAIARIVAREPYARVIIEPDRTLNVQRILAGPGPYPAAAPAVAAALPSAAARGGNRGAEAPQAPRTALPIAIGVVDVSAGSAFFSDLSITPNFAAGIRRLQGSIRGLTSAPEARARVDLHGEVGPYAPVSISGEVNVLGPVLHTDLTMNFRNIDLTIFNPYSGKFAGYDITKGKLTTLLHYKVDGRKLVASHHVIIDHLEFGPKTASKDAVSLPIKLAVALLKDRNGVIDLNFPVSGTLDDPKFRLGPVIWKVVRNLLVKVVTAPFAFLGSLFGAGPDIQYVEFHPGAAALGAAGLDRMHALAKAMQARPQLKIDVPIAPLATIDAPALAKARFAAEIADELAAEHGATKPRGAVKTAAGGAPPAAAAGLPAAFEQENRAGRLHVMTAIYRRQFGAAPRFPKPAAPPKSRAAAEAAKLAYLEAQLQRRIVVDDADLNGLAKRRAVAIEKALLDGTGVDPARVFLVANKKSAVRDGLARLQLSLR